jgi:hypothetical protein
MVSPLWAVDVGEKVLAVLGIEGGCAHLVKILGRKHSILPTASTHTAVSDGSAPSSLKLCRQRTTFRPSTASGPRVMRVMCSAVSGGTDTLMRFPGRRRAPQNWDGGSSLAGLCAAAMPPFTALRKGNSAGRGASRSVNLFVAAACGGPPG